MSAMKEALGSLKKADPAAWAEFKKRAAGGHPPTLSEVQAALKAVRKASSTSSSSKVSQGVRNGGYGAVPQIQPLLPFMARSVLAAYVLACLKANDGVAELGAGYVAKKLGQRSRRHGQRVLSLLAEAGLLVKVQKGSFLTPTKYRIAGAKDIDFKHAEQVLKQPLGPPRAKGDGA